MTINYYNYNVMMIVTLFLSMQTTFSFLEKIIAYLLQGHNSKVIIFIKKEKKTKKLKKLLLFLYNQLSKFIISKN